MPNRIIRESILTSRAVNQLSDAAELFYRRLQSVVDDYGRFEADPDILRARVYPLQLDRHSRANVCQMLADVSNMLTTDGQPLVLVYEVGGRKYLQISHFGQRTRTDSRYPPPNVSNPPSFDGHLRANVGLVGGVVGVVGVGESGDGDGGGDRESFPPDDLAPTRLLAAEPPWPSRDSTAAFFRWWDEYPQQVEQDDAMRAWISVITTPAIERALVEMTDRYRDSEMWAKGVYKKPARFIFDGAKSGFTDRPAPKIEKRRKAL